MESKTFHRATQSNNPPEPNVAQTVGLRRMANVQLRQVSSERSQTNSLR